MGSGDPWGVEGSVKVSQLCGFRGGQLDGALWQSQMLSLELHGDAELLWSTGACSSMDRPACSEHLIGAGISSPNPFPCPYGDGRSSAPGFPGARRCLFPVDR